MKGLLFTYVLTYGGAAVALVNPFVGLCIYVAFSILKPDALWPWSVPEGNYSRIVIAGTLVGWVFNGCGVPRFGKAAWPMISLIAFFGWCVLSAMQARDQTVAWAYIDQMLKMHLPVLVGLTLLNSIERLRILAWVIVLSQGYVAFELNLSYLGGYNALQEQGFAGMDNNSAAIAFNTALGMAFFLGMYETGPWRKGIALGMSALLAHAILFSFSRGGMLAMAVATGVGFYVLPKKPGQVASFLVAVIIGAGLAGNEVRARLSTAFLSGEQRDASAQSRIALWLDCWDVIQKNPILGAGPDHWPLLAAEYGWPAGKEAHSLWVQNAAELGVPGLLLLLGYYLGSMWLLWPYCKERTPVSNLWHRTAARMVFTSLVGFLISAQFVSLEALEIPYYVTLVGLGSLRLMSFAPSSVAPGEDSNAQYGAGFVPSHDPTDEGDTYDADHPADDAGWSHADDKPSDSGDRHGEYDGYGDDDDDDERPEGDDLYAPAPVLTI